MFIVMPILLLRHLCYIIMGTTVTRSARASARWSHKKIASPFRVHALRRVQVCHGSTSQRAILGSQVSTWRRVTRVSRFTADYKQFMA